MLETKIIAEPINEPIKKPAKKTGPVRDLPSRWALRLANLAPFRRMLANRYRKSLTDHGARLPALYGIDREIVAALERDGVYVTTLAALCMPGGETVLRAARRLAEDYAEEAHRRVRDGTDFVIVPPESIVGTPAIFDWGLSDRLLDIAENYLGLPAAYDGVSINYTVADGREVSTRKWHRDWEDRRMLKVAVYCNDVDDAGGPFQMISRLDESQSDAAGYRYELVSDGEIARVLGADFLDHVVSCEGPAGTVVLTDTARFFHRGKPAVARDRMAVFYSYFAQTPRHPFLCERSGLSRRQIAALAKGQQPRQRAAALWRETVPAPIRLIPPARI